MAASARCCNYCVAISLSNIGGDVTFTLTKVAYLMFKFTYSAIVFFGIACVFTVAYVTFFKKQYYVDAGLDVNRMSI